MALVPSAAIHGCWCYHLLYSFSVPPLMYQLHPIQHSATMFITTNMQERKPTFANPAYAREAIEVLYRIKALHSFCLFGFVIMPDHCHLLLRVPPEGALSKIMNRFKMGVSHSIGLGPLWQAKFHASTPANLFATLQYIHQNPVRAELVRHPEDYRWSSAHAMWHVDPLWDNL